MEGLNRIIKEYKDLINNPLGNCGVTVGLIDENNYRRWIVTIIGPKDTSYSGGLFYLSVTFPENYPDSPPEVCFLTPIYHLNVNPYAPKSPGSEPLGHVSISTLNKWKPYYKMREILVNIFMLLYFGNPDSPYGADRADEFRNNRAAFEKKVKYFTKKYANPRVCFRSQLSNKYWDFSILKNNFL